MDNIPGVPVNHFFFFFFFVQSYFLHSGCASNIELLISSKVVCVLLLLWVFLIILISAFANCFKNSFLTIRVKQRKRYLWFASWKLMCREIKLNVSIHFREI